MCNWTAFPCECTCTQPFQSKLSCLAEIFSNFSATTLYLQNTGTSLLETFDEHQIRLHIQAIQAAAAAQKLQVPAGVAPSDMCRVCGLTKLTFEPPLLYCGTCGLKIKRGQVYYCTPEASSSEFKVGRYCKSQEEYCLDRTICALLLLVHFIRLALASTIFGTPASLLKLTL
jgi:hypothetical protein